MKKSAAPSHLSAAGKRLWLRLHSDFVLDDAGSALLLQSVCEAFDRLQEARQRIKADGAIVRDRFNQPKPHPSLAIERDAAARMHSALRLLKLAPGEIGSIE